ncbi:MAG: putative transport system ATP-binding protein [Thermoleophilaceae bacterium]|nr:putative transport system ATP-binding protein [Thermoleophilaceae bacterium]
MTGDALVRCIEAGRTYGSGRTATVALESASCDVERGARVALIGPSGSGKSTLLHLMAGLDEPTKGRVEWPAIGTLGQLRPGPVAVIFQGPSLLPPLTVEENVALPLLLAGQSEQAAHDEARRSLDLLGLLDLAEKLPEEVSGGQAQRVAIARALVGNPDLIVADEPTGQLDRASAESVVEVLLAAAEHSGAGLVLATHDPAIAEHMEERWTMRDGRLEGVQAKEHAWSA